MENKVFYRDLGLIDYKEAWDYQESIFNRGVQLKAMLRQGKQVEGIDNYLIFCEHPHVFTLGKSGKENNLLVNDQFLQSVNATYYKINRGGDITYHGPGQLVGYPVLDLEKLGMSVKKYIYLLEEAIIKSLEKFNIKGNHLEDATGVWLDVDDPSKCRKICAIGVRVSRYITMHGFALNVNTDLKYFNYINPCGFVDKGVTSIQKETGKEWSLGDVKELVKNAIGERFQIDII